MTEAIYLFPVAQDNLEEAVRKIGLYSYHSLVTECCPCSRDGGYGIFVRASGEQHGLEGLYRSLRGDFQAVEFYTLFTIERE